MTARPRDDGGMILVNVLMFVAIAAGLVLLMIEREEGALSRALRVREAARAAAVVHGGEVSALAALRRDARDAPDADSVAEPWARLAETDAPIEGGTFSLRIADAEGKFNVNALRSGQAAAPILFTQIGRTAGIDDDALVRATEWVRLNGPLTDLRPLRFAGLPPGAVARLEAMVTALPGETAINLNAATPEVLTLLFRDPVAVGRLLAVRERQGYLTTADLDRERLAQPPGTSFRSNTFWVHTRARIGDTVQSGATLIQRRLDADGVRHVEAVARWLGASVPPDAPAFPARRAGAPAAGGMARAGPAL